MIYYLVEAKFDVTTEDKKAIEKAESSGCTRRIFFKIDPEGFIYSTEDRPSHISTRTDYEGEE